MSNIIQQLEAEQRRQDVPDFSAGDTIVVKVRVKEGNRERLQAFEGVVIAMKSNDAFTVRKISHGVGVERVFQTHSKQIDSIIVKRRGRVRRAKLYYMRERSGKSARIREDIRDKFRNKPQNDKPAAQAAAKPADATDTTKTESPDKADES